MSDSEAARPGGIIDRLGTFVVRWPLPIIGFWIALAALLALALPPLPVVAAKNSAGPLPDDAPTMVTSKQMSKAFHEGTGSLLMVILTDENGLGPADFDIYRALVDRLHQEPADKVSVQDFISTPPMHEVLASKDNKAWNIPITFPGEVNGPDAVAGYNKVKEIVHRIVKGPALTAHLAGPVAGIADLTAVGEQDTNLIPICTALTVLIILLIIYRNVVTMLVPLATIGLSVGTAQGVLAGLGELGLPLNVQAIVFIIAVMLGAGTDYAVFLISRYHDYVRAGVDSDQAVKNALMSIGKVMAASAATVAVTFLAMVFTKLTVFTAVGPSTSIAILVAFLAAMTLLPAILVLTGRRGWIKPRRDLTTRFWRRTGTRIVRRPKIHLVASLIVLLVMGSCTTLARFNYDDVKALPASADSVAGFAAMDRHYPQNSMTPMMLLIQSPKDLRTPAALADLEQMAQRVSQLPNIVMVRGLTRPNGEPLEQTKVSYQAGEVGGKLDEASAAIRDHGSDLDKLTNGSNQLADALAQIRDQVNGAVGSVSTLVTVLTTMKQLIGGDKTLNALDQTAKLPGQMRALGDALRANMADVASMIAWVNPLMAALNSSPVCNADPACVSSRSQLQTLIAAQSNGTLSSIDAIARNLQETQEMQTVGQTVDKLQQNLNQAVSLLRSVDGLQAKIGQMRQGANALAEGSRAIAAGVQELVNQTKKMGSGLNEASSFLLDMKHDAEKPSMAGFNIPPQIMTRDEFKKGAQLFISPDGHAARYLIQSALNGFTTEAMDQVNDIIAAARSAQPNTELSDATVAVSGIPSFQRDTRDYYNQDIQFIIIATIIIVFLILCILLRAIVAPLYLIGSVLVSFLSALGIGVLVFQETLGMPLHWSLPGLSFILLVAVGADYNMLLISRIRDESPHGVRVGVIRTVGSTGGVITSAGLIFAASMFGLVSASITTLVEVGFIIGIGIVIDTFLVRTITVPALAAMIGQKNWWPSSLGKSTAEISADQRARKRKLVKISNQLVDFKLMPSHTTKTTSSSRPATKVATHTNGHGRDARKTTLDSPPPVTNGEASFEPLSDHSLPLFDLSGLPHRLAYELRGSALTPTNGNGEQKIDDYLGHSLPLFGQDFPSQPISIKTNGNGHTDGKANGNGLASLDFA